MFLLPPTEDSRWRKRCTGVARGLAAAMILSLCGAGSASPPGECDAASALLLEGHAEEAASHFAELLRERPDSDCAVEGRVRSLVELDRWQDALRESRQAHAGRPESVERRAALGEALYRAGLLAQAEELLAGEGSADARGSALSVLGLLRAASGRMEEAVGLMERAVGSSPHDPRVLLRAAEAARDRDQSIARLERYLDVSAGDDPDRIEAARGALRTLRALGSRPVWVIERGPERVEIPLQLLADGNGRISGGVLRVEIGDPPRPVRVLLDTGSPGLFVVQRMARKRGFVPMSEETAFGGGGDQRHAAVRGRFPRIAIGDLVYRDALASTTEEEFDPTGRYHGVLGASVFEGYQVTIDLRRGRLVLDPPDGTAGGSRFWTVAGQMLVEATARGGETGLFLFDTGATTSVLDLSYAQGIAGVELLGRARIRGYGGPLEGARVAAGARVRYLGRDTAEGPLRAVDLSIRSRLGGVQLAGYVGLDLLGGERWIIDPVARTVRVAD